MNNTLRKVTRSLIAAGLLATLSASAFAASYVTATGKVHLRDEPSLYGDILDTMTKGETAAYLNKTRTDYRGVKWFKVRYMGETGWVSSRYSVKK